VHSYHWYRRQQPPVENGTCDISVVYSLVVSTQEAQSIQLDPKEYSETKCVCPPCQGRPSYRLVHEARVAAHFSEWKY